MRGNAPSRIAVVVALALALVPAGDALAAGKPKPRKPVVCKAGQVTVTVGKRVRCATLPKRATTAPPELAMLRAFATRDFGTVKIRGRKVRSIWDAGGGKVKRVRSRLLKALPKAYAFINGPRARAARVPGDPASCAGLPPGQNTASFDGFSMTLSNNGDATMTATAGNGYAIQVVLGGTLRCSDLELQDCPNADGQMRGTDGKRSAIGVRVSLNGELVQALRTTVRSRQTLGGEVADDAKLDRVTIEDVANETTTFQIPQGSVSLRLSVRRSAQVAMRSGATEGARVQVGFAFSGQSEAQASGAADQARRAYEQSFPELISEERGAFTRRETLWQGPNRCAKVTFSPDQSRADVQPAASGQATPTVEANAGGVAAKARWTTTGVEHGRFSALAPTPAAATTWNVTGGDRQRMRATFRATSTAGVAEGSWDRLIVDTVKYYKVTGFEYRDALTASGMPPVGTCTPATTQDNTTTFTDSGNPYDGAIASVPGAGPPFGSLLAFGTVGRTAHFTGCELNDDATAWVPCPLTGTGSSATAQVVEVTLPDAGPASVLWRPVSLSMGDVPLGMTTCVIFGITAGTVPDPITTTVPRETFTDPGSHTISVEAPAEQDTPGGTIHSTAHYAMTFFRVRADGSPYAP
jgi:hypothetical protein